MKRLVGGEEITPMLALKISEYINNIPGFKRECYGWAESSKSEVFLIYNNKTIVTALTFYMEEFTQNGKPVYIFKEKEIGFANITVAKRSKNIHVDYIKVYDKYQSMGIGKQLLAYIESYGKSKGCKTSTLDCLSTYTDGKNVLPFRNGRHDIEKLKQMKIGGLKVVDKNMQFYLSSHYKKQKNRKPMNDYLTPMIKNNIKLRPIEIKSLLGYFHINISRNFIEPLHLSHESTATLNRLYKKPFYSAFDIKSSKQL